MQDAKSRKLEKFDVCLELAKYLAVKGIMHPLPFFATINKPAGAKNLHVMRKRRLGNIKGFKNIASAHVFGIGNEPDYAQSIRIRQRLKQCCSLLLVH